MTTREELESTKEYEHRLGAYLKKMLADIPCDLCDARAGYIITGKSGSVGRCKDHPFSQQVWPIK